MKSEIKDKFHRHKIIGQQFVQLFCHYGNTDLCNVTVKPKVKTYLLVTSFSCNPISHVHFTGIIIIILLFLFFCHLRMQDIPYKAYLRESVFRVANVVWNYRILIFFCSDFPQDFVQLQGWLLLMKLINWKLPNKDN